jgi:hypothetical protein
MNYIRSIRTVGFDDPGIALLQVRGKPLKYCGTDRGLEGWGLYEKPLLLRG